MPKLSVTIITLNEENNIAQAIESVSFADEIILVDSHSTDRTVEIAKSYGAIIYQHDFKGHGEQKNIAANFASNDWILNIDADERIDEQLQKEIKKIINQNNPHPLWKMKRKNFFCGKWIKYGGWYPDYNPRLYLKNHAKFTTPFVHEELKAIEKNIFPKIISGNILHYSFPSFFSQIKTNMHYATLGHQGLKHISFLKILYKPLFKFIECYFLKLGIADGKFGLVIAINASYSQFVKYAMAYFKGKNANGETKSL